MRCFKCLQAGHAKKKCKAKVTCVVCGKSQYAILCRGPASQFTPISFICRSSMLDSKATLTITPPANKRQASNLEEMRSSSSGFTWQATNRPPTQHQAGGHKIVNSNSNSTVNSNVYLETLLVKLWGPNGCRIVRAMIDGGSSQSYVLKDIVKQLGLQLGWVIQGKFSGRNSPPTRASSGMRTSASWMKEQQGPRQSSTTLLWKSSKVQSEDFKTEGMRLFAMDSRRQAEKSLNRASQELQNNGYFRHYQKIFEEWQRKAIIEKVSEHNNSKYYLSHRAVVKTSSSTTPVRYGTTAEGIIRRCVTSFDTLYQARTFQKKTQDLLLPAKFNLRDWEFAGVAICESEKIVSTLGMEWNMKDDMLGVPRSLIKLGDDSRIGLFTNNGCGLGSAKLTKSTMLSETNTVLDPLGLFSPLAVVPKIILQKCWQLNTKWDESVPDDNSKDFLR
ncbi:hypothetical protein ILUMI_19087 [Ignelater luminosus]|uniref:CCHC-type domain-containing protein n=1 Tax=Ignelater luminosus TaxID=2038154 RepID=A0A8K0G5X3_IGNLU|nr:hypothetical protein ILUMI_19087 [Ignelater luminosus]